jgi:cytochrome c556
MAHLLRVCVAAWAVTVIECAWLAAPAAQQAPANTTPQKPVVPVAASSLAANPETFYGDYVSLTATVDELLSKSAFSVDQDRSKHAAQSVLVLAPTMTGTVDPNAYVTVLGEVMKFDPVEIARRARDYTLDLSADLQAKFQGRPVVLATAVINAAGIDVARRLPPPMTAEEESFSKTMKRIGPSFTAFRQAIQEPNAVATKEQIAILKQGFTEAEAFWKKRGTAEAVQWTAEARKLVDQIDHGLAAAKWDDVKTAATDLGKTCQTCHGAYRERFDDGSYRIKAGAK